MLLSIDSLVKSEKYMLAFHLILENKAEITQRELCRLLVHHFVLEAEWRVCPSPQMEDGEKASIGHFLS